jgi:hypothetical protein
VAVNSGYLLHVRDLRSTGERMTRFCPYCGVAVPSNCVTCPKCFKNLPREDGTENSSQNEFIDGKITREKTEVHDEGVKIVKKNRKLMLILAIIPAFFGVLGLAQIYREYRNHLGYFFLIVGLILFIPSVFLIMGVWTTGVFIGIFRIVAYIILTLLYLSAALASVLDAAFGSVFKIIKL